MASESAKWQETESKLIPRTQKKIFQDVGPRSKQKKQLGTALIRLCSVLFVWPFFSFPPSSVTNPLLSINPQMGLVYTDDASIEPFFLLPSTRQSSS